MTANEAPYDGKILEIKIKNINQLFNSLDPSPFIEKDLDDDAVEYIFTYYGEFHLKTKIKMMIHLPESKRGKFNENHIKSSIKNFFVYRNMIANNNIILKIAEGKQSIFVGLGFLIMCLSLKYMISTYLVNNIFTIIASEALMILGWVAMWKPINNILYDWWPLQLHKKLYEKISKSEIEFVYY